MQAELRRQYLGWTILQRSCELSVMARELGNEDLEKRLIGAAERVGAVVGASKTLIASIVRGVTRNRRRKGDLATGARQAGRCR